MGTACAQQLSTSVSHPRLETYVRTQPEIDLLNSTAFKFKMINELVDDFHGNICSFSLSIQVFIAWLLRAMQSA